MCALTVFEKIKNYASVKGISVRSIERTCGFANAYFKGLKGYMGSDKLEILLYNYPDLNKDYIMDGKGEMLNEVSLYAKPQRESNTDDDLITGMSRKILELQDRLKEKDEMTRSYMRQAEYYLKLLKDNGITYT